MKKNIIATTAAFLSLSLSANCFAAISFADINDVPWEGAKTYINRAADLGLMQGSIVNNSRYFYAKNSVTCFETVQLIYNLLKQTGNLGDTAGIEEKWSYVLKGIGAPDWTKQSLSYALEKGIVSAEDVKKFLNNALASREAVAVMMGKAMTVKYSLTPNATLQYADKASVNSGATQYLELLYRLGVMQGDSDNNFNPKIAINRAEMAATVTRAYDKLKETDSPAQAPESSVNGGTIANGVVISAEDYGNEIMCVVKDVTSGAMIGLFADANTKVTNNGGGAYSYKALSVGDTLSNVVHKSSEIESLNIVFDADPNATSSKVTGSIDEVNNERIYLTNASSSENGYAFSNSCEYSVDGKNVSQKVFIETFDENNMDVELYINPSGEVSKAVGSTKESDYKYGILVDIDRDEVIIKRTSSSSKVTYEWAGSGAVTIQLEGKDSTISAIDKKMDSETLYVKYVLNSNGDIKKLFVSEDDYEDDGDDDVVTGYYDNLTDSYVRIKSSSNGTSTKYTLDDDCVFKLEGSNSSVTKIQNAYDDAEEDDDNFYLKLEIEDNKVIKLWASVDKFSSSSNSYNEYTGYADGISSSKLSFKKSSSGSYKDYYLADSVTYKLNGDTSSRSEINDAIKEEDELEMTIRLNKDDEVTRIEAETSSGSNASGTYSGEISSISSSSIKLKKSGKTYDLAAGVSIKLANEKSDVSEIRDYVDDGDATVEAEIVVKSGKVTSIKAEVTSLEGELKDLNVKKGTLKIKTSKTTYTFDFNSNRISVRGDCDDLDDLDYNFNDRGRNYDATLSFEDDMYVSRIDVEKQ